MNKAKTLMTFVLDETGSMQPHRDMTISGFNEFLESQKDKSLGECRVTLVKFNSTKIETVYSDMHIDDVPLLSPDNYQPDHNTPNQAFSGLSHATSSYRMAAGSLVSKTNFADAADLAKFTAKTAALRRNYWHGKKAV